jgi:hypothetical protein
MQLKVTGTRRTDRFDADVRAAPIDVARAAEAARKTLIQNSRAGALRLHPLKGYPKPTIFKIDVTANHSWQLTFELDGEVAVLLRLATHKAIDRDPR